MGVRNNGSVNGALRVAGRLLLLEVRKGRAPGLYSGPGWVLFPRSAGQRNSGGHPATDPVLGSLVLRPSIPSRHDTGTHWNTFPLTNSHFLLPVSSTSRST